MKIKCHNQQINYKELDEINGRFSEIFRKIFENYMEIKIKRKLIKLMVFGKVQL